MSKDWFRDIRQRFIEWRLVNYGSICGRDIAETFGVSTSQGSIDIQAFSGKSTYVRNPQNPLGAGPLLFHPRQRQSNMAGSGAGSPFIPMQ